MPKRIAFLVEGEAEERFIRESSCFPAEEFTTFIYSINSGEFCRSVLEIIEDAGDAEDLDFGLVLQEVLRRAKYAEPPERGFEYTAYYCLFDLDPQQAHKGSPKLWEDLAQLLSLPTQVEENFVIFISYPMFESLRHFCLQEGKPVCTERIDLNEEYKIDAGGSSYKAISASACGKYSNPKELAESKHILKEVCRQHIDLAQKLTDQEPSPQQQQALFQVQNAQVNEHRRLYVISAVPLLLHDYFGQNLGLEA